MVQWIKTNNVLAEDLGSVPTMYIWWLTIAISRSSDALYCPLRGPYSCVQGHKYTHSLKFKKKIICRVEKCKKDIYHPHLITKTNTNHSEDTTSLNFSRTTSQCIAYSFNFPHPILNKLAPSDLYLHLFTQGSFSKLLLTSRPQNNIICFHTC